MVLLLWSVVGAHGGPEEGPALEAARDPHRHRRGPREGPPEQQRGDSRSVTFVTPPPIGILQRLSMDSVHF